MVVEGSLCVNALKHHREALQGILSISVIKMYVMVINYDVDLILLHKYRFHDLSTNWFENSPQCAASIRWGSGNVFNSINSGLHNLLWIFGIS